MYKNKWSTYDNSQYFCRNFKPTFECSKLSTFCNFPSERAEIKFVLNYWPFSQYKSSSTWSQGSETSSSQLTSEDRRTISKALKSQFKSGSIRFDDEKVMDKVRENLKRKSSQDDDDDDYDDYYDDEQNYGYKRFKYDYDYYNKYDYDYDEYDDNDDYTESDYDEYSDYDDYTETEYEFERCLKFAVSTERGKMLEPLIIEKINKEEKMNFVKDSSLIILEDVEGYFKLSGIPDGIDNRNNTIIEVKTRENVDLRKRRVELSDRLQCLAYLKLTSCKRCLLVVSGPDGRQNRFDIEWSEREFERRIASRLRELVKKYRCMSEREFSMKVKKYEL